MAKATVKRRKNATAPVSIGKRIKVQAQRKFALGAAIIPVQLPKETVSPLIPEAYKEPPREVKLNINTTDKASTEDFLTFLCFKGTTEIPHTDSDPVSQIQRSQYSNSTTRGLITVQQTKVHSSSPQPSTSVQGFIPFGVRKQASQFPARNSNTQLTIQALRSKYNREKQAKLCALAFKKSGDVCHQPKRVQTRSTKDIQCKPVSKRKPNCIPLNFKAGRRPTSRPRPDQVDKSTTPIKLGQNTTEKNVSLRNRIISVHSANRLGEAKSLSKEPDEVKKQVAKQIPLLESRVVLENKIVRQGKHNIKQTIQRVAKNIQTSSQLKSNINNKTNVRTSPRNIIITRKTVFSKNNLKASLLKTPNFCQTRAGTVRKFVTPGVKNKIVETKEKKESPPIVTNAKKKKKSTEVIDFSSDDDEPLYKKLATDAKLQNIPAMDKEDKLKDAKLDLKVIAKVHDTRRNIKSETVIESSLKNAQIIKIGPCDKNMKTESIARTTRQHLKSPTNASFGHVTTADASTSPLKCVSKGTQKTSIFPLQIATQDLKILKDRKRKVDKFGIVDVNVKSQEISAKTLKTSMNNEGKVDSSAKRRKFNNSSDLLCSTEIEQLVKELEKSFSDSDEEPLAAKIPETTSKSSNTTKKLSKPKRVPKNDKIKSPTAKKPNLSILIDTETREIADNHVKIGNEPPILQIGSKIETIPTTSQEESSKNIATVCKLEETPKMNVKKSEITKNEKNKVCANHSMAEAKRKTLIDTPNSQMPSGNMSKNECKDNRNRKFIKSKEYIERWLDNSLRLAVDSPSTELMSIHGGKTITPVDIPLTELVRSNVTNITNIGNKNMFTAETNTITKLMPDKKRIIENKRTQTQPIKQCILPDISKESDSSNIPAFAKLGLNDPSSNIYEFDSESEMVPFPRKSSASKPSDDRAWKPKFSKDVSKGKTPLYNPPKRRIQNTFTVEESDSSTSKIIVTIDNGAKITPIQSTVASEPTEFPISSTAEDSSLDVHTLVTSEDMPPISQPFQSTSVFDSNTFCGKSTPNEVSNVNGDDSEGHLFYIPLQGVTKTGVNMEHLIQGVAVKLGTQGPDGSHQRVIMRAKLVTKSQVGNSKNVSENLANQVGPVQDMVRSVLGTIPTTTPFQNNFKSTVDRKSTDTQMPVFNINTNIANSPPVVPKLNPTNKVTVEVLPVLRGSSKSSTSSSQRSTNTLKRGTAWNTKIGEVINHTNNTAFPQIDDPACMVEAPVFRPTEKEFQDPLEFIEKISPVAARYGLCRIVPPANFKSECKISDDMRFTPHNQYLHRMLYRWGPSSREMCAIKKYLATQSVSFKQPPSLSAIEVDLPKLYHIVQNMGGLKKVLEKKMWLKVAEEMCIPLNVNYMDIRLDEIYCKYLLPYDTLSVEERRKLFESVDLEWEKRQSRMVFRAANPLSFLCETDVDEQEYDITEDIEECITRGKSMTLCSFARTAKNTMTMHYGKTNVQPIPDEVETKFWQYVTSRKSHVCVSTGSIDSSVWGYGFPNAKTKNTPISKHPWNLKVLTNNSGSVLRSLGPIMGVTVPTLHVGMAFSACCWYRDPHGLPWIEYLHEGAPKIWYGVPDSQSAKFKEALTSIVPGYCQRKTIWLLSDTTMVPPTMLTEHGVSLCRTVQQPGEYILVFPKAFTSSICTGYNVSESVYFASNNWLDTAQQDFTDIRNSCEPSMFSLERLIVAISEDVRSSYQVLKQILPTLNKIIQTEKHHRERLFNFGLKASERSLILTGKKKIAKRQDEAEECHRCRTNLYLSMLYGNEEGSVYCLVHGAEFLAANPAQVDSCKLVYLHSIHELNKLLSNLIERINHLANKKSTKLK